MSELNESEYWEMLINRSVSRLFLLSALHQRPMHGYEIAKFIKATGCCDPSDAMIYPALRELLDGGYLECRTEATGGRERKVCSLTEKGEEAYRAASQAWERVLPIISQATEQAGKRHGSKTRKARAKSPSKTGGQNANPSIP